MNLNIKKLTALSGVSLLAFLSTFQPLTNADAALTEPASWDYAYKYDSTYDGFLAYGDGSPEYSTIQYNRTTDGAYYNYSYTGTGGTTQGSWPFEITMTFNRSNTPWGYDTGTGKYEPFVESFIGSDNTVGSGIFKSYLTFNNQTNKDYAVYLDYSTTNQSTTTYGIKYNDELFYTWFSTDIGINTADGALEKLYIPAFTEFEIWRFTSGLHYFDAWYLQDLGVSDSYTQGITDGYDDAYDDGYAAGLGNNPNILLSGFQAMVGILVNFFLLILNLEVFNVSIMSVFSILALFVGVIWFLKLVRG